MSHTIFKQQKQVYKPQFLVSSYVFSSDEELKLQSAGE